MYQIISQNVHFITPEIVSHKSFLTPSSFYHNLFIGFVIHTREFSVFSYVFVYTFFEKNKKSENSKEKENFDKLVNRKYSKLYTEIMSQCKI